MTVGEFYHRQGWYHSDDVEECAMSMDWNAVLMPTIGLAEVMVRGTIMYLGLFVVLRFVGRRQAGISDQPIFS